jgi:L-alanine-DL-glutamate epimerase-like enolase superfamily enzyme
VGEAFYFGGPATLAASVIEDALGPLLLGGAPFAPNVIWDHLYN